MGELIDGLLDLSRISRATLEKDDVDLSAMAEEIMKSIEKRQPAPWARTRVEPVRVPSRAGALVRPLRRKRSNMPMADILPGGSPSCARIAGFGPPTRCGQRREECKDGHAREGRCESSVWREVSGGR
jgi:hypothetical protein